MTENIFERPYENAIKDFASKWYVAIDKKIKNGESFDTAVSSGMEETKKNAKNTTLRMKKRAMLFMLTRWEEENKLDLVFLGRAWCMANGW